MQVQSQRIKRPVFDGEVEILVSRPKDHRARPGILLAMDADGLSPWLEELAERLATLGYVVAAPDLYHRLGGQRVFGPDEQAAQAAASQLNEGLIVTDMRAALDHLKEPLVSRGRGLAVLGFGLGGRIALQTACHHIELRAAVSYAPLEVVLAEKDPRGMRPIDRVQWLRARLLAFYAGRDQRVPAEERRVLGDTLRELNKPHELVVFPDAEHGFWDERSPSYDEKLATQAWQHTSALLEEELKPRR